MSGLQQQVQLARSAQRQRGVLSTEDRVGKLERQMRQMQIQQNLLAGMVDVMASSEQKERIASKAKDGSLQKEGAALGKATYLSAQDAFYAKKRP